MARIKYDVRGVEGKRVVLPAGVYNVKIVGADVNKPEGKDERIEVTFEVVGDKAHNGVKLYEYINTESEAARWKLREFLEATGTLNGGKESGVLDTSKLLGTTIGVKTFVRPADDQRGFDEQARIRRMFEAEGSSSTTVEDEDLDDDTGEDEDDYESMSLSELKAELTERGLSTKGKKPVLIARLVEDDETDEEEDEDEDEAYSWEDIQGLSRAELRQLNRDEELGVKITKSKDDDVVRAEIAGALDIDVPEVEEEDEEAEEDDYDEWTDDELKEELSQRSLSTKGSTKLLLKRLRKDDAEEEKPF